MATSLTQQYASAEGNQSSEVTWETRSGCCALRGSGAELEVCWFAKAEFLKLQPSGGVDHGTEWATQFATWRPWTFLRGGQTGALPGEDPLSSCDVF